MMSNRKPQILIEAIQWDGTDKSLEEIKKWVAENNDKISWQYVMPGDYVIKSANGKFYFATKDTIKLVLDLCVDYSA